MMTDHPIYIFLRAGPEAFRVLTGGHTLSGAYRFSSLTIKSLERRLDGILEPDGHAGPAYVVEFQGQPQAKAWYNLLTKMGLYGEQFPEREVLGIGVLLRGATARTSRPGPTTVSDRCASSRWIGFCRSGWSASPTTPMSPCSRRW